MQTSTRSLRRAATALVVAAGLTLGTVGVLAPDHASVSRPQAAAPLGSGTPSRVLVIAHRGDSAQAPENTIPAMTAAARAGADMVEFDVQRTRDGQLIVVHDPTFARTTDVATVFPGRQHDPVGSFTLAQVRRLDAGSWMSPSYAGTRVPTLAELLAAVRPTHLKVLAELKKPALYPGVEQQLATTLGRSGLVAQNRVYVHSFDASSLQRFHALAPGVPLGLITTTSAGSAGAPSWLTTVNPTVASVSDSSIDAATASRHEVFAWPDSGSQATASQIERVVDDGVSGVITDDPRATEALIDHTT